MNEIITLESTNDSNFDLDKEEVEIQSGQYWRLSKTTLYKKGTILLIASLNIIDNILHSLELSQHPVKTPLKIPNSDNYTKHRVSYDEFINDFEFVPLEEALRERELEIAEEEEVIEQTREELLIGYIDEETGINATELISNIVNKDSSSAERLPLKIGGDVKDYENQASQITDIANNQREFINGKNQVIKRATTNLACYYQEKGDQALASVDSTMKYVAKLTKGIETLSLLTGKGVHVKKIRGGKDAPYEAPITFYQRKLYFDEETYFDVMMNNKDAESLESFNELLEEDISYINRMIPSERGVVLMQYRRKNREFFSLSAIEKSGLLENSIIREDDETHKIRFLLIRNGENVYKVDCQDFFEAQRLFPTAVEMDSFFKKNSHRNAREKFNGINFGDGNVNPNELEYVEARDKHDAKAIFYKRVLIILSGIHSREPEIFGRFKGSNENIGAWYNLDFQRKSCHFVHDDEDALDDNIEPISSWLSRKQDEIMSGSRLLCQSARMINTESSPMAVKYVESSSIGGGYSRDGGDYVYFTPNNDFDMSVTFEQKNSLFVKLDCKPTFRSNNSSNKMINIELDKVGRWGGIPYIVLDAIKKSELDYYLNSRKQRENYLDFADLLLTARKYIDADEKEQKEFLDTFKEHIFSTYNDFNDELLIKKIDESIRLYRVGNKGDNLPKVADKNFKKNMNKVSKILHKLLYGESIIENIKSHIKIELNQELLKIVINNKGEYLAYTKKEQKYSILNDENIVLEAHVYKVKITGKDNTILLTQLIDCYYENLLSEKTIYLNNSYSFANTREKENKTYYGIKKNSFEVFKDIDNSINEAKKIIEDINSNGIKLEVTKKLLQTWLTKNKNVRKYYKRMYFTFPVALVGLKGESENEGMHEKVENCKSKSFAVVYSQVDDIADFITYYGDDESFDYIIAKLEEMRFKGKAKEFQRDRKNRDSSFYNPLSIFANLHHFDYDSDKKLSSNYGFYKEDFYSGNNSHYVGRFYDIYGNDMRNNNSTLVELLEFMEKKHFEGDNRTKWTNGSFDVLNKIEDIDNILGKN